MGRAVCAAALGCLSCASGGFCLSVRVGREYWEVAAGKLEWVRRVIVFHAAIAVKPKASKMYYT